MDFITVNSREFRILRLLGKGKGGYSYLGEDETGRYVIKQIHHEPCDYYTFGDKLASECRDYERLSALGLTMPKLLDVDEAQERLLKEYIPGETMDRLILRDGVPDEARWQLQAMCDLLYPAGLNIDYFPTNFIFHQGLLYYIDYECNGYMSEWDYEHWGRKYWYRTEEFLAHFQPKPE
ncbi:MAG: hypothetical protein ACI4ML_07025 [Aristaeellaceae bacterium]